MKKGRITALIALILSLLAIIAILFMPYFKVSLFGMFSKEATGMDLIENLDSDSEPFIKVTLVSYIFSALGFIAAVIALIAPKFLVTELLTSAFSIIFQLCGAGMFVSEINDAWNESVGYDWEFQASFNISKISGYGFWMYFSLSLLLIIASITGIVFAFGKKKKISSDPYQYADPQPQYANPSSSNYQQNTYNNAGTQSFDKAEYRFCTNCGAKIPANSRFCLNCGARQDEVFQQPSVNKNPQTENQPYMHQENNAEQPSSDKDFSDSSDFCEEKSEEPTPAAENSNGYSFCPVCGEKVDSNNSFCTNCGAKIQR